MGDFKFDYILVDGENFDMVCFVYYGDKGVLCLFSDFINFEVFGFCLLECLVFFNLDCYIGNVEGWVIVIIFVSLIYCVLMILGLVLKNGCKVGLLGCFMFNVIVKVWELGYMCVLDELFVLIKQINDVFDWEILLLMIGSQGELLVVLSCIFCGEYFQVKVKIIDMIIFLVSLILGNMIFVVNIIDKLMMLGVKVVYGKG